MFDQSARARATAAFIPWMRSSRQFPDTEMTESRSSN